MTWAGALLAAILLAGSGPSASAQQRVGYVLQMEGTWMLDGASQPLGMGQALPGGALLLNAAPRDEDNIVVADLKGEIIKTVRCKSGACKECHESAGCHDPIRPLPDAEDKTTMFGTMLDAVLELFTGKPDRYSIHRVRGSESAGRRDGVARLDGSTVDVSYFMEGQEGGPYELQFVSLARMSGNGKAWNSNPININWNPGENAPLVLKGIQPGLYRLSFERKGAQVSAWVLLCDSDTYPSAAASFEEFAKQMNMWGDGVTQDTKKSYQRAYLDYLARKSAKSAQ